MRKWAVTTEFSLLSNKFWKGVKMSAVTPLAYVVELRAYILTYSIILHNIYMISRGPKWIFISPIKLKNRGRRFEFQRLKIKMSQLGIVFFSSNVNDCETSWFDFTTKTADHGYLMTGLADVRNAVRYPGSAFLDPQIMKTNEICQRGLGTQYFVLQLYIRCYLECYSDQ